MRKSLILCLTIVLTCLLAGSLWGARCIFSPENELLAVGDYGSYNPSPLLDATLIDSFEDDSEYDWSLNADFAWANVFDTNDITEPHTVTQLQYYASPTLGVEYEFYITTDAAGWPDDDNLVFLASSDELSGGWGWVTIDLGDATFEVEPGQTYWFVRTCPVGGWPGFTWSSATCTTPPVNPPVKITMSFPSGGWSSWIEDWWMLFRIYGEPAGGGGLEAFVDNYPSSVQRGTNLQFTAGVENTGADPAAFDQANLVITGPASLTKGLYNGPDITLNPGQVLSRPISLFVPPVAPLGWYTVEVEIYLDGGFISSDAFDVEVVN